MLRINIPKRYRGECEGEWKCADAASISMTSVKKAAMGCMIRIAERVVLVEVGRSKLLSWSLLMSLARCIKLELAFQRRSLHSCESLSSTHQYCTQSRYYCICSLGRIRTHQNQLPQMKPAGSA